MNDLTDTNVLTSERDHFDREASELGDNDLRIQKDQIQRYRNARWHPRNTAKDALFASLLPVEGDRILDYGCGTGDVSCELALCGANVTGIDVSPISISRAKRRAEIHGVEDRTRFDVRQAGNTGYAANSFDIVVGSAILHHLHTTLPTIYQEIDRLLGSNRTACFLEPVANSSTLRWLRRMVPVRCEATPDERQLYYRDFEPLKDYFRRVEFLHFYCLDRLHRLLGQVLSAPLRVIDHYLQRFLPITRRYYGTVVVVAQS